MAAISAVKQEILGERCKGMNTEEIASDSRATWLAGVALGTALYLMYSPVFLSDYLMNDEWYLIGSRPGLRGSAREAFFVWGRGLFGIYSALVYRFAGYDPFRIQLVRFVNFASLATIALLLFVFLRTRSKNVWFSFFAVLFLFSQPSFQGSMAYSLQLISNTQPAMWLSLLAFYLHFHIRDGRFPKPLLLAATFLVLVLAMQSTQTYAFFSMVPLTYLTLSDWKNQHRKISEFLVLALLVFLLSSLMYTLGIHYWHSHGHQAYKLGEEGIEAMGGHPFQVLLHAANPLTYWSAFEMWSYPFPFHDVAPLWKLKIGGALLIMAVWAMLLSWAVVIEAREGTTQERRGIFLKWLAVFVYMGFAAVFIVADSPLAVIEHRPHLVLTFSGIAILSAAYSLEVLTSRHQALRTRLPKALIIVIVAMTAFGAQAAILRGYVDNRMEQMDFIRTQLMSEDPSTYRNIVVVVPKWSGCLTEPCGLWVGHVTEGSWHITRVAGYRYGMATTGISPDSKNIIFTEDEPKERPKDSIVIDWQKYVSVRQRRVPRMF